MKVLLKQNIMSNDVQTLNEKIATAIVEGMDGCDGLFAVSVEIDESTVAEVSGWYEIDGYRAISTARAHG